MPSLDEHRKAIDALDREILERLNARAKHAQAIGELKGGALAYRRACMRRTRARCATSTSPASSGK
jgi:chorismate mutase